MLNKVQNFMKRYNMLSPGDTLICAVSGGADSMALLFAMYLLAPKLSIKVKAAHFNHHLRGEESDRDEAFVREFCKGYDIPLFVGSANVQAGPKGLEAAAREARYEFLRSLPGKIATAHTANDNAETVLMHLVRGTGLKGLGGIMPINGNVIRPMLSVTRDEVVAFLEQYHVHYITDSSNQTDRFLRNRLRHSVMPVLEGENPQFAENVSAMALRLRQDEEALAAYAGDADAYSVTALRNMPAAVRNRTLANMLEENGVKEPEAEHIALAERIVMSDKPSAKGDFSGGITMQRVYDSISFFSRQELPTAQPLPCPGSVMFGDVCVTAQTTPIDGGFCVASQGSMTVRPRQAGDTIRLCGGSKTLKKLYIDRKIPEYLRKQIPVVADESGVLAVYGIGPNLDRLCEGNEGVYLHFRKK